jgi:DNA repair exonuclease SbcCD nuclease subunit
LEWADDDDFEVKVPADKPTIVNAWDDEDEDTGGPATDNWEDFDKPKEPKPKPTGPPEEKKTFTQVSGKKKRGKALLEKIRQKEDEEDDALAPLKLTYEEKKKLQEQVVASDLENAKDMFAVKDSALKDSDILFGDDDNGEAEAKTEITLDSFKPRGERDYIKLAELVSKKVEPFSVRCGPLSPHASEMLRRRASDLLILPLHAGERVLHDLPEGDAQTDYGQRRARRRQGPHRHAQRRRQRQAQGLLGQEGQEDKEEGSHEDHGGRARGHGG